MTDPGRRAALWILAAVAVPAALAGIGMLWVRPAVPPVPSAPSSPPPAAAPSSPPPAASAGAPRATPTPGGAAVAGQVAEQVAGILGADPLLFDGERADLRPTAAGTVDRVAALLTAAPGVAVRLVGHTADLPGPPARAVALSRERAEAVAARLVAAGVDPARITVEGVGEAEPLATPEASRRVEVRVG